jgi:hypothetical protein
MSETVKRRRPPVGPSHRHHPSGRAGANGALITDPSRRLPRCAHPFIGVFGSEQGVQRIADFDPLGALRRTIAWSSLSADQRLDRCIADVTGLSACSVPFVEPFKWR